MNPDPATNPAPETPTPLAEKIGKEILNHERFCSKRGEYVISSKLAHAHRHEVADLERALAEAKRENEHLRRTEGSLRRIAAAEIERLKADKERLRVALRDGIDKLETLVNVHDDGSAYVRAKLRMAELVGFGPAIDRMKEALYPATQEGQG